MENNAKFVDGFRVFMPHEKAPDFIKADIQIECKPFIEYCRKNFNKKTINGKEVEVVSIQLKMSKQGKLYAELNTYRTQTKPNNDYFGQGKTYEQAIKHEEAPLPTIEYPMTDEQIMNIPF